MENNHQRFEEWLFADDAPPFDEAQVIHQHLEECAACRELSLAWRQVEGELRQAPQIAPAPGFSKRWMTRMLAERAHQHKRQTLAIFAFSAGGASLLGLILFALFMPLVRYPILYLSLCAYQVISTLWLVNSYAAYLASITRLVMDLLPPAIWLALGVAFASLGALWIVLLRKFTHNQRMQI